MSPRESTDVLAMFKALADPTRARIFEFLCSRCCALADESEALGATVGEVCSHVAGESFSSTISFHLKELRIAGLISAEKQGKYMLCAVRREAIDEMKAYLERLPAPPDAPCRPAILQEGVRDEVAGA